MRAPVSFRFVWLALAGLLAQGPATAQVRDVDLKAAYIYNFAQFTTWPELGRAREPFTVCANADSFLWNSLQAYNGKLVNNRNWQTVDMANRLKPGACDLLVLAHAAERPPVTPGLLVVRDGAASVGGAVAITLVEGDEQIRFDIDTQAAMRNGLRFSSRLLRLARNVK